MSLVNRSYDYDQYVATKHFLREKIEEDFGFALDHLKRCDQLILESVQDVVAGDALAAALHAHSLYLAACDLARTGHLSALFPLFRTAMESAVYGCLFVREEGLSETWRKRHHSEEDFASSKTAFTKAMVRFRKFLQDHDKNSGGTPYEEHIMGLYDAAIDYGAHPNPIALARNISVSIEGDKEIFRYKYLQEEVSEIIRGLVACFDYGIAIAEINYLSKMQANPGVYNLDLVFLEFCRETNAVVDRLNGQAIGFSQRHYNRVNPGVVPES